MTDNIRTHEAIVAAYNTLRAQPPWQHDRSAILHHRVLPFATYAPWLMDPDFLKLYEQIKNHTLVDIYRCHELWSLAKQVGDVEGDVLEVGVWRGGTGAILASAVRDFPDKQVFLADTFKGVVKAGQQDTRYTGGEHSDTSRDIVSDLMETVSLGNTTLLQGIFPDDTQHIVPSKIAMLHCDVDVYSSSKDIVDWCLPRLSVEAIMVFDDYGFFGCEGVTKLCNELRNTRGLRFMHNLNGHAVFVKFAN
ncbi:TylF/MycF family methyltransferase [Rhodoferax antarcticus]|uniref:TylF/MycF family methyltransferase n=1 Tax=Rhodoferax antarcticus TaxID=81479 RepID=UPI0022244EA9|nr:TylF/MycF family methyltransferase [Rhodoferax antarcticus]MCW2312793.1 O-methyltransferase [Rhodoferax antarcticus]